MHIDWNFTDDGSGIRPEDLETTGPRPYNPFPLLAIYGLILVFIQLFAHSKSSDYVGFDNDDAMRLVEVRDLLAGQSWFDLTQYRIGLENGVLMHWSRFVDLPIALLIRFFSLFTPGEGAEALALAVWPQFLSFTIVVLMGMAGLRAGGRVTMNIAAGMTVLYVYSMGRFMPGSADHHNLQLTFATLLLVMLLDPRRRASNYAIAGFAAAMEIAIGAEAVPHVAAVCLVVACLWAWHGEKMRRAAAAFGLSLLFFISAAFFGTVPPHLYGMVTCDSLSLGFYSLATVGGGLLFLSAAFLSGRSVAVRVGALGVTGAAVLATAGIIAPQCLGNPLGNLDPMLTELWLSKIIEAYSMVRQWHEQPGSVGAYYGVAFAAILLCLYRILRGDRRELHLIVLPLLAINFAIAAVQVRGTMFSNLITILPMAVLVTDLRAWQQAKPDSTVRSLTYLSAGLLSLPLLWSLMGLMLEKGWKGFVEQMGEPTIKAAACGSRAMLQPLNALPTGTILAPSELGTKILRFTSHRALSAPYHRNQAGMLTELNTGLSMPEEAIAFLRGAKVDYVLFCSTDAQTQNLARMKPEGFYGSLLAGRVPAYLEPLNHPEPGGLEIFRVLR